MFPQWTSSKTTFSHNRAPEHANNQDPNSPAIYVVYHFVYYMSSIYRGSYVFMPAGMAKVNSEWSRKWPQTRS